MQIGLGVCCMRPTCNRSGASFQTRVHMLSSLLTQAVPRLAAWHSWHACLSAALVLLQPSPRCPTCRVRDPGAAVQYWLILRAHTRRERPFHLSGVRERAPRACVCGPSR